MNNKETVTNEKIEDLNLVALRKYACGKVSGSSEWYLKCVGCPGLKNCRVGKRAVDIMEGQTAPKPKNFVPKDIPVTKATEKYIKAMEHEDPPKWLVDHGYFDKWWVANDNLKHWVKRFPEVVYVQPVVGNTGPSLFKSASGFEAFLEGCRTADEFLKRYLERTGNKPSSSSIYRWKRKYPDVIKKHPYLEELAHELSREYFKTYNRTDSGTAPQQKPDINESEEVSIEDFLQENKISSDDEEKKPAADEQTVVEREADESFDGSFLKSEFAKKRHELNEKLESISLMLISLKNQQEDLIQKLEALNKTAELFGIG